MSRRLAFTLASKPASSARIRRIRARTPRAFETGRAPETVFRPEQHADLVAGGGEGRRVRIVRAADEIHAGVLHHLDVAEEPAVGHRVAPAGVVLVHVGAFEIAMLAVEEKSLVGGELEPAETQRRLVIVHRPAVIENRGLDRIQVRMLGRPELRDARPARWSGRRLLFRRPRIVCVDLMLARPPSLRRSSTPVRTAQVFAAADWFTTSVLTFTVPRPADTCGVVTNVPYQVDVQRSGGHEPDVAINAAVKTCSPARGARRGFQMLFTRTATTLPPVRAASVMSNSKPV